MIKRYETNGDPFGSHRVVAPKGVLPQPAEKLNNDMSVLWDNEILVDVEMLNIDSASFTQIEEEAGGDAGRIKEIIRETVKHRGKQHNPVTGSGGMFIGKVAEIGEKLSGKRDLQPGDPVVSLVSLSLTPLNLLDIHQVYPDTDQVEVSGQAILFESGVYARLPDDLPSRLVLAALDVCGAPAQTARLVRPGDTVVIIGAGGKSGVLCAYEARKRAGVTGMVIGTGRSEKGLEHIKKLGACNHLACLDASDALSCYQEISRLTGGRLADVVINCVNVPNTELGSILMCKDGGRIYFFSMATSFTKAALGAEGVGKDVEMIIGNGYTRGHAAITLEIIRESAELRKLFESLYCG